MNLPYKTSFQPDYIQINEKMSKIIDTSGKQPTNPPSEQLDQLITNIKQQIIEQELQFIPESIYTSYASINMLNAELKKVPELCQGCGDELKKAVQCQFCGVMYCKGCCSRKRIIPGLSGPKQSKTECQQCHSKFVKLFQNQKFYAQTELLLKVIEFAKNKFQKSEAKVLQQRENKNNLKKIKMETKIKESTLMKQIKSEEKKINEAKISLAQIISAKQQLKLKQQAERKEQQRIKQELLRFQQQNKKKQLQFIQNQKKQEKQRLEMEREQEEQARQNLQSQKIESQKQFSPLKNDLAKPEENLYSSQTKKKTSNLQSTEPTSYQVKQEPQSLVKEKAIHLQIPTQCIQAKQQDHSSVPNENTEKKPLQPLAQQKQSKPQIPNSQPQRANDINKEGQQTTNKSEVSLNSDSKENTEKKQQEDEENQEEKQLPVIDVTAMTVKQLLKIRVPNDTPKRVSKNRISKEFVDRPDQQKRQSSEKEQQKAEDKQSINKQQINQEDILKEAKKQIFRTSTLNNSYHENHEEEEPIAPVGQKCACSLM